MATFLGTETYSIDDKNRVVVPAAMRRVGGSKTPLTKFVLMRGLDGCVWLYAEEDWKRLEDLLQRLSTGPKAHRAFARTALVGASKVAVYRDAGGQLHQYSAVCPHLQCIVAWNGGEKTWDCPCHGSRFNERGEVVNGPANSNLSPAS